MAAQKGRELLLKVSDGAGGYEVVGGFTSNNFSIDGQAVDITSKDTQGFRASLSGGGIVGISTTAQGVFLNDDAFKTVHDAAFQQTHLDCQLVLPGFMSYTADFIVTSLSLTGGYDNAVTYDISLESAGPVTATPAP